MSIVAENLVKAYDGHPVVNRVSLEVADGEFFVLLGPSGSGKSTVLRMIAGLVDSDEGRVLLHGRDVTSLPPQRRGVGFVFQHYALFGHMSVGENIEFALKIRRVRAAERRRRRDELLELVGLAGLGDRMPTQLSGGQRQRVALARALAHNPDVLLLDEPFGALDAKIRVELRRSIRAIQRELGIATIFVTHDQEEAFELADRLGIVDFGRLLEVGPPHELYLRPQTEFVATFLGTANLMVGEVAAEGVRLGSVQFPLGTETPREGAARRVQVLFRPEDVALKDTRDALGWPLLGRATVEESTFVGSFERLRLRLPPLPGVRPITPVAPFGGDFVLVDASRSQHQTRRFPLKAGDDVWVGVRRIHALVHPGLSLLLLTDGTEAAEKAVLLGGEIARMARARVTILAHGLGEARGQEHLQRLREAIRGGLAAIESRVAPGTLLDAVTEEAARRHYDLVVTALPPKGAMELAELLLAAGDHNLLLAPPTASVPERALVCTAVGEPGKEGVQFAARFIRHLGAQATILTVLRAGAGGPETEHAQRFLAAGVRTLSLLGVPARSAVRVGDPLEEIQHEAADERSDLVVVGTPLTGRRGKVVLAGIVENIVKRAGDRAVLLTRSHQSVH